MTDEANLVSQALTGVHGAFDDLIRPHLARAYRTACLITQQRDLADDALQEALVRTYQCLHRFRPSSPFYPWFIRIVVNEAIRQTRNLRRENLRDMPEIVDENSPEALSLAREERERVWSVIQRLSVDHRTVIVLRYFEELTEAEISSVLGVSRGTVKSRLNRARRALDRQVRSSEDRTVTLIPLGARGGTGNE